MELIVIPTATPALRPLSSTFWRPLPALATVAILSMAGLPKACGQKPADLIQGIASRSAAIVSGRLTYSFRSESFIGERALDPVVLPVVTTSFSNSSWADRTQGSPNVRINHDGYFLEFVNTPQRNGPARPGVILRPIRSLASRTELNSPPVFAGSFWYREQLRFVENHCDDFRIVGSSVVNAVPVTILEVMVPAESHRDAFHVILPQLQSGGIMRLYVAPQLGFVLPRMEFVTASHQVAQTYNAKSFDEVAPGIYFPAHLSTETHATGGTSRYRGEFAVRCELINQPIPAEDFIVPLPTGTRVQDARQPNSVIKFELTKVSSSGELPTPSSISELGPNVRFLDRWRNAVIVGLAISGMATISFLLAARNQRYSV